jgi:aminoglycoside phosphotransferase (APT) family kinase protein
LSASLPEPVVEFLRAARLAAPGERPRGTALSGGVSSDIWRVELASGPLCVKGALPRLRVSQVWEAPVERNRYEYEWLRIAGAAAPGAAPRVFAERSGLFAMEYLELPVWKEELRRGRADPAFAAKVGATLAAIHSATAGRKEIAALFRTDEIFRAIRLEPYLVATAERHAALRAQLMALAERTAKTQLCLVHGDVSPKNILVSPRGPVFLDAECAWYGDPAFDLAFCLNHLLLKCVWVPAAALRFLQCFDALKDAYFKRVTWEETSELEQRTSSLLPGLLLARIDGKSPVEYITSETDKESVRRTARDLLLKPVTELSAISEAWRRSST